MSNVSDMFSSKRVSYTLYVESYALCPYYSFIQPKFSFITPLGE